MMKRYARPYGSWLIVLGFALAGCTNNNSDTNGKQASDAQEEVPIDVNDPFATLLPWPEGDSRIMTAESGLQYIVLISGSKDREPPRESDLVVVHYDGRLASDGQQFDSSRVREQPAIFPAGKLIKGWVEALQLMRPGDRWMLYIPYALAYGAEGRPPVIPPTSDLIFDVELLDVRDKL